MTDKPDVKVDLDGSTLWLTIDREDTGNTFSRQATYELAAALRDARDNREVRVVVITGAGDKFFCIGGEKEPVRTYDYSSVLPIVDVYELIDQIPKPVIAAVNGFAVGGGNVLQTVCDLTIASDQAVFRQIGPSMGSFDAGFGTWMLEETIGRKRAKEMWYLNRKYSAHEALAMGLVNEVVAHDQLVPRTTEIAEELAQRGPSAIAGLKVAFSGRHTGVIGQARMGHDLLLTRYLDSRESAEMGLSFTERRPPDPEAFDH